MFTKQVFVRNIIGWVGSSIVIVIISIFEVRIFETRPEPQGKDSVASGPLQRIKLHICPYIHVILGRILARDTSKEGWKEEKLPQHPLAV